MEVNSDSRTITRTRSNGTHETGANLAQQYRGCTPALVPLLLLGLLLGDICERETRAAPPPPPDLSRTDSFGSSGSQQSGDKAECGVISDVDKNYLSPIDVAVKNEDNKLVCLRARFALSIKVEEAFTIPLSSDDPSKPSNKTHEHRATLGYLPLENVLQVENTCPEPQLPGGGEQNSSSSSTNNDQEADSGQRKEGADNERAEADQLEMIVTFECGKLSFTFNRDKDRYFMSSIKGLVKLDKKVKREFIVNKPMFLTTDLNHRFKYDDLIEVASEAQSTAYILSANFYFTEIEAFRNTSSRDFTRPPDDKSQPFEDNK